MLKPIAIFAAFALALACPAAADEAPPPAAEAATAAIADDVPQTVKDACKDDYEKNCKQHAPESNEVRECMARAFEKLSDPCVTAILDSSLADQAMPTQEAATPREVVQRTGQLQDPGQFKRKHAVNATRAAQGRRYVHAKPQAHTRRTKLKSAKHLADARVAKTLRPHKRVAVKANAKPRVQARYQEALRTVKRKRSVAGYIKRGTGIANYYVAKYTRFAFAKAFR